MTLLKEIRLFGITSVVLIVFGAIMLFLSGKASPDILTLQAQPTIIKVVTAIVVTQTREPDDPFVGVWECKNADQQRIIITKEGNFHTTTFAGDEASLAVQTAKELTAENGTIMRLNDDADLLAVRLQAGKSFFCTKGTAPLPQTPTPTKTP